MLKLIKQSILVIIALISSAQFLSAKSVEKGKSCYQLKPNDPSAVYFTKDYFNISNNGKGDDAPALQAAIDLVVRQHGRGIVFIPEGTYRLGKTIYVYAGVRLYGYGAQRPVFLLGDNTPGFQEGEAKYMVHFCYKPGIANEPPQDANNVTFFTGISNINFEIGNNNPAAVAVRFRVAQLSSLEHIDFQIGSGRGGVEDMGNEIENCTFSGGEWGIKTGQTSPGWQALVMDCNFIGQRTASMITKDAGMTIIRCHFKDAPVGISIPDGTEQLYARDTWFVNIEKSAIEINNYFNPALHVNLENITFYKVSQSVRFAIKSGIIASVPKESLNSFAPSQIYIIKKFSHGLHIQNKDKSSVSRKFTTEIDQSDLESIGSFATKDIPPLPPQQSWVNIVELGARGDGNTDCTDIFKNAIARYNTIYIPMGKYLLSETLSLTNRTILIGLHPFNTKMILKNETPGFADAESPKPLISAPRNGTNGITGIGFDLGFNPGAIGVKWLAGSQSFIDDVYFNWTGPGANQGKGQMYGIWITDGGGGTFKNIWLPNELAQCAFYLSNTTTKGRIYEVSVEHHKEVEFKLKNVENWEFYALQTEENIGSERCLAIEMDNCKNISFANLFCYRISAVAEPFFSAIKIRNTKDLTISGMKVFSGGPFPFDNSLHDETNGITVSNLMFTKLVFK